MISGEPDEIVPVPPLNPAFPAPAEDGVHLSGEEVGKREGLHVKRDRLEKEFVFCVESGRGVGIDLDLDLYDLAPGYSAHDIFAGFYRQELLEAVCLEKSGLNRTFDDFLSRLDADVETEGNDFAFQGVHIARNGEIGSRLQQGKVEILRKALHAVQDSQRRAAVESCLFEELGPPQPKESKFLEDLPERLARAPLRFVPRIDRASGLLRYSWPSFLELRMRLLRSLIFRDL